MSKTNKGTKFTRVGPYKRDGKTVRAHVRSTPDKCGPKRK